MISERKRLVLGEIDNSYDHQRDILLGPWCLLKSDFQYRSHEINFPPDPLMSSEDFDKFENQCSLIFNELFSIVVDKLNRLNNTKFSPHFWHVIASPWLTLLISSTLEKKIRLNKFLKEKRTLSLTLTQFENDFNFEDTNDFILNGLRNPLYIEWILSLFINDEKNDGPLLIEKKVKKFTKIDRNCSFRSWKERLKTKINFQLCVRNVKGINLVESFLLTIIIFCSSLSKTPKKKKKKFTKIKTFQSKLSDGALDINWEFLIEKTLPNNFKNLRPLKPTFAPLINNKIIVSGTELYTDEEKKLNLALFVENGGELFVSQHGSNYGYLKYFSLAFNVEYNFAGFFSWGWKSQSSYNCNFIDLPSPMISKISKKFIFSKENSDIIFVSTETKPTVDAIVSIPQPVQLMSYRKDKLTFFNSLPSSIRENIYYRPYFNHPTLFNDKEFILKYFKDVKICSGDLHRAILNCKLIIMDNPGTTLNICLGANIPTICYWRETDYIFDDNGKDAFLNLRNVGILHSTPGDAAKFLKHINSDVFSWWNTSEVQSARLMWSEIYARKSEKWFLDWIRICSKF